MKEEIKQILWVDDEIDQLKSHIIFLEQKGYRVTATSNGADAINLVSEKGFDLVLLDEMMPGQDGLTTLEEMKRTIDVVLEKSCWEIIADIKNNKNSCNHNYH
jgi:CheY-like chemotaxis protein